jgi:hypothetical protein
MPPGDVGDDPPQAENNVASVAPEAAWQAPAQNRRRETGAVVSDIEVIPGRMPRQLGNIEATPERRDFF